MDYKHTDNLIKNIDEVLNSETSSFSDVDLEKLKSIKETLNHTRQKQYKKIKISPKEKEAAIQAILILMEILKHISDHFK